MRTLFTGIAEDEQPIRARYGEDVVFTPLIEIVAVDDDGVLRDAFANLKGYDYLLFTSRFAVRHCAPLMEAIPRGLRVVSIGTTTTRALHQCGIGQVEQVEKDNSFGVVEWFGRQPRGMVFIPRSNLALPYIPDGLERLGFNVDAVTAYVNRMPEAPRKVSLDDIDRIVFTSPSTVRNFISLYGALPDDKELVARGPITKEFIKNMSL